MINDTSEEFLDKIVGKVKYERKIREISQLGLSQILGFSSPNYIAKIETRNHNVSYNLIHLYKIAESFNMEVVDFIPSQKN